MEMPDLLPKELQHYRSVKDDEELLELLIANSPDLLFFFEEASDDQTWGEEHSLFVKGVLKWLTEKFSQNSLQPAECDRIVKTIHTHQSLLFPHIPMDIIFVIEENPVPANSLLFGTSSNFFHSLIRNRSVVPLENVTTPIYTIMEEFILTGNVATLWKFQEKELLAIHQAASKFRLIGLGELCEVVLKRYITRENVLDTVVHTHRHKWSVLRQACFDFVGKQEWSCRFHSSSIETLAFEFFQFNENSTEVFQKVKNSITDLVCGGKLIEEKMFASAVSQCPHLRGLDISQSRAFDESLHFVPDKLRVLNLSDCPWLDSNYLSTLFTLFPMVRTLAIRNNSQLTFNDWGNLQKLKQLLEIDVSNSQKIGDDEIKLIVQSAPHLIDLNCNECRNITNKGFFEIIKTLTGLSTVSLQHCLISDGLLAEMTIRCYQLKEVDIQNCPAITDRGLLVAVRQARTLQRLLMTESDFKKETINEIKRLKPFLLNETKR